MTIKGTVESVKILKEGVGKNKDGKFIKVVVGGKDYVTFDTKFLEAVGLEGEFEVHTKEYNGKTSTLIDLPKIKDTGQEKRDEELHATILVLEEDLRKITQSVGMVSDFVRNDIKHRGKDYKWLV